MLCAFNINQASFCNAGWYEWLSSISALSTTNFCNNT